MKYLLLSVFCLFSLTISAQIEILKNQFPYYQGILPVENKTSSAIYANIKSWVATRYNSANDVIQLDDKENGKLIVKAISPFHYGVMGIRIDSKCFYTLTIDTKENKFRYTIDMTEVEVGTDHQSAYKQLIEKPDKKQSVDIMKRIEDIKNSIILGLNGAAISNDNNW